MTLPVVTSKQMHAVLRYLAAVAAGNLLWEIAHVPLYMLWLTGTAGEIAYAVLHCTAGDVLIAAVTLALALVMVGRGWPDRQAWSVTVLMILLAVAYTVFSEWLNTSVRGSWAYRDIMPTLPPFETGLTPVLQWIVVPVIAFRFALRPHLAE